MKLKLQYEFNPSVLSAHGVQSPFGVVSSNKLAAPPSAPKNTKVILQETKTAAKPRQSKKVSKNNLARSVRRQIAEVGSMPHFGSTMLPEERKSVRVAHRKALRGLMGDETFSRMTKEGADEYVESLLIPEAHAARIPSATGTGVPTMTSHFRDIFSFGPSTVTAPPISYGACLLRPDLFRGVQYANLTNPLASPSTVWNDANTSEGSYAGFSALLPVAAGYRIVSYSATLHCNTGLSLRTGEVWFDLISGTNDDPNAQPNTLICRMQDISPADVKASASAKYGTWANEFVEDSPRVIWLPLGDPSDQIFKSFAPTENVDSYPTMDPGPGIMLYWENAGALSVTVEVHMNVEWIPLYAARRYLTPEAATGDSASVAKEFFRKGSKIASSIISTVKDVTKLLGPLSGDFTGMTSLIGNVASGIGEALSTRSLRGLHAFRDTLLGHPSHPLPLGSKIVNDGTIDDDVFSALVELLSQIDSVLGQVVLGKSPTNVWKKNYLRKRDVPLTDEEKSSVYVSIANLLTNRSSGLSSQAQSAQVTPSVERSANVFQSAVDPNARKLASTNPRL